MTGARDFGGVYCCGSGILVLSLRSGGPLQGLASELTRFFLPYIGSTFPTFLKEVHCPPSSAPPGESLPGWSWVPMCGGEEGGGCAAHRRSQLPLDAEKSNFLPNCHRPHSLSPHSLLLLGDAWSPTLPLLLPPATHPTAGAAPPSRSPVSGRTIYHVRSREGLGERTGTRPGLPDEIVLFRGGG